MKQISLITSLIAFCFFCNISEIQAFDAITKINLRNSYSAFERCMESSRNDITQCFEPFQKVVDVHRAALKVEPGNEKVKNDLLVVLNSMNDIAQTYFEAASKKRGNTPFKAKQYFLKAAICYDQLAKVYSKKPEFSKKSKKARYLAAYEETLGYIQELKSKTGIKETIYSLEKLKKSRDRFQASYKSNSNLNADIASTISELYTKMKTGHTKVSLPDQMPYFLSYILLQNALFEFDPSDIHKNLLATMKTMAIDSVKQSVTELNNVFGSAVSAINKQEFLPATKLCEDALEKTNKYPDVSLATPDVIARIKQETKSFNISEYTATVQNKLELAKTSLELMEKIESGKTALNEKKYYDAYSKFIDADIFLKNNQVAVKSGTAQRFIDQTIDIISKLKPSQIDSINLARLYYEHLSFSQWLAKAESGKFSKDLVYINGSIQQQIGNVVILQKDSFKYSFLTDSIYRDQTLNNVGVIFNDKRLIREGRAVECIGKYRKLQFFETVLGVELKIPVFTIIWPN